MTGLLLQAADWGPGLVDEQTIYLYTAILLGAAALGFLVWTVRLHESHRRYGLLAAWVAAAIAATYVAMHLGLLRGENTAGAAVPVSRFVGYQFSILVILVAIGHVAGMSRRLTFALLIPFWMITGGTAGGWFLPENIAPAASLSSLLSLPLIAYLLLRSGRRAAAATTPNRKLLYGKLANVTLLVWLGYLVVGIVSRQNLAVLDAFVGVSIGTYLDVILHLSFGVLLLRHTEALDDLVAGRSEDDEKRILDDEPEDADAPAAAD